MQSEASTQHLDLDTRIRLAEQRLITREEQLRSKLSALVKRVEHAVRPRRLLVPALGGALALLAAWWLWRHGAPRRAGAAFGAQHQQHHQQQHQHAPPGGPLWLRLLPFVWPLVPARWRGKISPATATAVVSVGLPLAERLLGRSRQAPLVTVPQVDLARYAGTWNEIARLPDPFESFCGGQPTATYLPQGGTIGVINRCLDRSGTERAVHGTARVVPGSGGAKLQVTMFPAWLRWLPFAWADYWILALDPDYRHALVGNPTRSFLWVLSRQRTLPEATLQALVATARDQGFPVQRLKVTQPA